MEKKFSPNMTDTERRSIPNHILKQVYDKNDNVLFGSTYVKGKVAYNYLPGELMETGRRFIVNTSISYDGRGNSDLPANAELAHFDELPGLFPDNKFK